MSSNKYELIKFADYEKPISRGEFTYHDGYYFLEGYLDSSYTLTIFKNNNIVFDNDEDTSNANHIFNYRTYYACSYSSKEDCQIFDFINEFSGEQTYTNQQTYTNIKYIANNCYIATLNDKYGLIDKDEQVILPFEYSYISGRSNYNYLAAIKDEKVGIVDLNGKIIIPFEYDYTVEKFYDEDEYRFGSIEKVADEYYFILHKNAKNYVLNSQNEVIIESTNTIVYNNKISKFEVRHEENDALTSIDYYSPKGELIKTLDIAKNWSYDLGLGNLMDYRKDGKLTIIQDMNSDNYNYDTIYVIDSNLNIKKLENIAYVTMYGDGAYYEYFVNEAIYILQKDGKYEVYDFKTNQKIDEYSSVYVDVSEDNMVVCKEEDRLCALASVDMTLLTDFIYDYKTNADSTSKSTKLFGGYLISDNSYINSLNTTLYPIITLTCNIENNFQIKVGQYWTQFRYIGNNFVEVNDEIYDLNCQKYDIESMYEIDDKHVLAIDDSNNFYLYTDLTKKPIVYKNVDNVSIKLYLGYVNDKLFFVTDKGIYSLEYKIK